MTDPFPDGLDLLQVPPDRLPGVFTYALDQLEVQDDGLAPGHSVELIDVVASLAELVKRGMAAEHTPEQMLLRRLAMASLDLLSTAFSRTAEDRDIVRTWRQAYAEWRDNRGALE
ncbi:hypothetical protein [Mycobacterium noviomagense]|uniref:Uncharacterized protein n=1 Tax=Mycobacterium noviomagense TaxID=459858 RepID=A0A7I7PHY4_9MYCO|nr:hypothetical protein [Mycobacterium noviomagense]BBY08171.1 hypothetical protein MNVI_34890 [Mycobacterium noviomagense]